ncbi:MAG: response regulator [Rhizobiaceae bacterium]
MPKFGFKALILDDSLINIALLELILNTFGLSCRTAETIQDASELLADQQFDVSFIDFHMPGQNGGEFIKVAEANGKLAHLRHILIVTADVMFQPKACGLDHLISGFILKPIDPAEIEAHLRRELYGKRSCQPVSG